MAKIPNPDNPGQFLDVPDTLEVTATVAPKKFEVGAENEEDGDGLGDGDQAGAKANENGPKGNLDKNKANLFGGSGGVGYQSMAENWYDFGQSRYAKEFQLRYIEAPFAVAKCSVTGPLHLVAAALRIGDREENMRLFREQTEQLGGAFSDITYNMFRIPSDGTFSGNAKAAFSVLTLGLFTPYGGDRVVRGGPGASLKAWAEAQSQKETGNLAANNYLAKMKETHVKQAGQGTAPGSLGATNPTSSAKALPASTTLSPIRDPDLQKRLNNFVSKIDSISPPPAPKPELDQRKIALGAAYQDRNTFLGKAYENYNKNNGDRKSAIQLEKAEQAAMRILKDSSLTADEVESKLNKSKRPGGP